jgi:hypothetical protein
MLQITARAFATPERGDLTSTEGLYPPTPNCHLLQPKARYVDIGLTKAPVPILVSFAGFQACRIPKMVGSGNRHTEF